MDIPSIENDYDWNEEYKSVIDRYYIRRYCLNVCEPGDDYCILIHSNRVCLVTLAPSHKLITEGKSIVKIDFQVTSQIDRLSNKVSGKWKHGAQRLKPTSPILYAETTDGSKYKVCSAITGKLVEVNQALLNNPNILTEDPQGLGYIAIVLPDIQTTDTYRQHLLSEENYALSMRNQSAEPDLLRGLVNKT